MEKLAEFIKKNKVPLAVLCIGAVLMLMPVGAKTVKTEAGAEPDTEERRMEAILAECEGVGRVRVMLGERDGVLTGCVVVCDGARSPSVRLSVAEAASRLTGLGIDRIRVINMKGGEK